MRDYRNYTAMSMMQCEVADGGSMDINMFLAYSIFIASSPG